MSHSEDWNESRIRRDYYDGDVVAYCQNCGTRIDLLDGAIWDCPRCATTLREEEEA